jgi:hypothetical protein
MRSALYALHPTFIKSTPGVKTDLPELWHQKLLVTSGKFLGTDKESKDPNGEPLKMKTI